MPTRLALSFQMPGLAAFTRRRGSLTRFDSEKVYRQGHFSCSCGMLIVPALRLKTLFLPRCLICQSIHRKFNLFNSVTRTQKKTRLWLKNLPLLEPTNIVEPVGPFVPSGTGRKDRSKYGAAKRGEDAKNRAKTFPGIADAMAVQWGFKE